MATMPTPSRANRPIPISTPTQTSSRSMTPGRSTSTSRAASPPYAASMSSFTASVGPYGQTKMNIVTRVAIEGKAKQDQETASIRMYLKLSVPLESASAGSTVALFPEENIKILSSMVHPLRGNGSPYNFSSTVCPLLHSAARALDLPARHSETFDSTFNLAIPDTSSSSRENAPVVDMKYTGHIVVSAYQVSYVLPKVFLHQNEPGNNRFGSNRRMSFGDKHNLQFMAAIDMLVPYASAPPRAPYVLSVPTPRCLNNNVKLRIWPMTSSAASFHSLSSADGENISWDMTSDPHVTRGQTSRMSRANAYNSHFADDESSDSSTTGFAEGCGIQGSFPSAERIRVRWAKPQKSIAIAGDGRRRVGVKESKVETTCIVRGVTDEGTLMDIEHRGACRGLWFPGVATMLGMDVVLEAKGSDVSWAPGAPTEWKVTGGNGFTGFDVRRSIHGEMEHQDSTDSRIGGTRSPSPSPTGDARPNGKRFDSTSSTSSASSSASLLRAPLPHQNESDYSYSFEGAASATTASSSIPSLSSSNPYLTQSTVDSEPSPVSPVMPITLHVNMNEFLPPSKNILNYTISGTVLISPRPKASNVEDAEQDRVITLPRFSTLAADTERTSIVVRHDVENANVEVYNATGDVVRDPHVRKTVLQKGGYTKCGDDGGRIAVKSLEPVSPSMANGQTPIQKRSMSKQRVPSPSLSRAASPAPVVSARKLSLSRLKREGPLMIPSVEASVTPLLDKKAVYAVRMGLISPNNPNTEWLEFGLADSRRELARVDVVSVTVDGVPVRFEASKPIKKDESHDLDSSILMVEASGKDWMSWVKIQIGASAGGQRVEVDYVVSNISDDSKKGKEKARDEKIELFLPTFPIPVGKLEVRIDEFWDLAITELESNLSHRRSTASGRRLMEYSLEEYFYPHVSFTCSPSSKQKSSAWGLLASTICAALVASVICFAFFYHYSSEIRQIDKMLERFPSVDGAGWIDAPGTITVTSTHYTIGVNGNGNWWFSQETPDENPTASVDITSSSPTTSTILPTSAVPIPTVTTIPMQSADVAVRRHPPSRNGIKEIFALVPATINSAFKLSYSDFRPVWLYATYTARVLGRFLNRAWHYPLPPP